tara:strand:+ start:464 stop:862 length:399 start_codon:yes stop_codon:yes gene_type:complete
MGFAQIVLETSNTDDGSAIDEYTDKKYLLIFDSLRDFNDEEYIRFKTDFNDIFNEETSEIIMTLDTRNIETIPLSILYDFSHNLLEIKPKAERILNKTIIVVSRQIVINAFKILFTICSPISEIEYVFNYEQ